MTLLHRLAPLFVASSLVVLAGSSAGGLVACSAEDAHSFDTRPMLMALSDDVMLASLRELDARGEALLQAATTLEGAPTEANLMACQAAWREARKAWRQADAFQFGPVKTDGVASSIDFWPASEAALATALATGDTVTIADVELLGANARGFLGLELVLFDNAGNASVLAALTTGDRAPKRRAFVRAAAAQLRGKVASLLASWSPDGASFAQEIATAGAGSKAFPLQKAAVDQLVNQLVFASESVSAKIAKPFGLQHGGAPQPALEETPRSDNSIADMQNTLISVKNLYTGAYGATDGLGVSDLVRAKNAGLDARVLAAITKAQAAVAAIPPPFRMAITANKAEVQAAYDATRALKVIFTTEVAGVLGTTVKMNDNDGD